MKFIFLTGQILIFTNFTFAQLKISEILFNPKTGGVDFVEIYNDSPQGISLNQFYLGNVNQIGKISNLYRLTEDQILIGPHTYKVLTTNPTLILQQYSEAIKANMLEMHKLPSFPNTQGHVVLVQKTVDNHGKHKIQTIDSLHYSEKMHSKFLKNPKGVSLERSSFKNPTNAPGNFRSSAIHGEGATPGYRNSIYPYEQNWFRFNTKILNPDRGPYKHLEIEYELKKSPMMANLYIYNQQGLIIKRILKNKSISTKGIWIWDGCNDHRSLMPIGIYTAYIELYDEVGYRQVIRKSFVLTY